MNKTNSSIDSMVISNLSHLWYSFKAKKPSLCPPLWMAQFGLGA